MCGLPLIRASDGEPGDSGRAPGDPCGETASSGRAPAEVLP
jgi:hypothetical protein